MIDSAFEVPDRLKVRRFKQKYILRAACRGMLTASAPARKALVLAEIWGRLYLDRRGAPLE
jgi:hypothetical protein